MKYRKAILGLSIALGVLVGGYLSAVAGQAPLAGAMVGGLLAGLVYYVIDWAVSRRRTQARPYDSLEGHQQANTRENIPTRDSMPLDSIPFRSRH